jgi:predicted MPP superfamily phosphohydrolase
MAFKLREVSVPILPANSKPLRILHFSDLHLTPKRHREIRDIQSWGSLEPDLVVSTGDFLAHRDAINTVIHALGDLLKLPGVYVFGSNDYFAPRMKNPFSYLKKDDRTRKLGSPLPTDELDQRLRGFGWKNVNESKVILKIRDISIEVRGTDDAHLNRDNYTKVASKPSPSADLSLGVTHAPYLRILDSMKKDNLDLIFAGHTHGGQVRFPWFGGTRSLTTNCDLPNWRSRGLTQFGDEPWLHVSAGMGYNPYTPIRLFCPPEASIVTLTSSVA